MFYVHVPTLCWNEMIPDVCGMCAAVVFISTMNYIVVRLSQRTTHGVGPKYCTPASKAKKTKDIDGNTLGAGSMEKDQDSKQLDGAVGF